MNSIRSLKNWIRLNMKVNNYNFKYIEKGNGDPIVFVHGSVSDYRTWSQQMEEFSKS